MAAATDSAIIDVENRHCTNGSTPKQVGHLDTGRTSTERRAGGAEAGPYYLAPRSAAESVLGSTNSVIRLRSVTKSGATMRMLGVPTTP